MTGKPKVAKVTVQSVELTCPYCQATIAQPDSGSLYWTVAEINQDTINCFECGVVVTLPRGKF